MNITYNELMTNPENGSKTFGRGDTRPYLTLGRKDSMALDISPVGH